MNTLNLGSDEMPEKKKKSNTRNLKIALGLAAVILVPTIGSTLAGSITVGGVGGVEFGQGIVTTAACDSEITVTPASALVAGAFVATTVAVSGIDNNCDSKFFTLKILNGSTEQIIGDNGEFLCKFQFTATAAATTNTSGGCYVLLDDSTSFTFQPGTSVSSDVVGKITLESSSS
jgi:hypothetical protein